MQKDILHFVPYVVGTGVKTGMLLYSYFSFIANFTVTINTTVIVRNIMLSESAQIICKDASYTDLVGLGKTRILSGRE